MRTRKRFVVSRPVRRAPDPAVQPSLLEPLRPVVDAGDLSIQERFERFDALNPQVYRALLEMALMLKARGQQRIGVKMMWEVLRFRFMVETVTPVRDGQFGWDNNLPSRYARKLAQDPRLVGMFELRTLKAE